MTYNAPIQNPQSLIWAYAPTIIPYTLTKHQNYGSLLLTPTTAIFQSYISRELKWLHGYGMALIMFVTFPLAIFYARYKPIQSWLVVHLTMNTISAIIAIVSPILIALFDYARPKTTHGIVGITVISLMVIQFVTGGIKRYLRHTLDYVTTFKVLKITHSISGKLFWVLGVIQVGIGLNTMIPFYMGSYQNQWAFYFGFIIFWILIFAVREFIYQKYDKHMEEVGGIKRKGTTLDKVNRF